MFYSSGPDVCLFAAQGSSVCLVHVHASTYTGSNTNLKLSFLLESVSFTNFNFVYFLPTRLIFLWTEFYSSGFFLCFPVLHLCTFLSSLRVWSWGWALTP